MSGHMIQIFDSDFDEGDKVLMLKHDVTPWAPRAEFEVVAEINVNHGNEAVAFSAVPDGEDVSIAIIRRKPVIQIAFECDPKMCGDDANHFDAYGRWWSEWEDYSDGPETIGEDVSFLLRIRP